MGDSDISFSFQVLSFSLRERLGEGGVLSLTGEVR
jgi:hypothetical protein